MAVITFPGYCVNAFRWVKTNQAMVFRSVFGAQSVDASVPLWVVEIGGTPSKFHNAHRITAFLESLDGYRNQLALWNLAQPVPVGSMRGTMTLNADVPQGATSIEILAASEAGETLLAGDLVGIGAGLTQQVVRIAADAVANSSGVISVSIGTPLRNAFTAGEAIAWDKPKALFRQSSLNEGIEYVPGIGQGWSLSLIEDWRP